MTKDNWHKRNKKYVSLMNKLNYRLKKKDIDSISYNVIKNNLQKEYLNKDFLKDFDKWRD